jgi:hypothetical protein
MILKKEYINSLSEKEMSIYKKRAKKELKLSEIQTKNVVQNKFAF